MRGLRRAGGEGGGLAQPDGLHPRRPTTVAGVEVGDEVVQVAGDVPRTDGEQGQELVVDAVDLERRRPAGAAVPPPEPHPQPAGDLVRQQARRRSRTGRRRRRTAAARPASATDRRRPGRGSRPRHGCAGSDHRARVSGWSNAAATTPRTRTLVAPPGPILVAATRASRIARVWVTAASVRGLHRGAGRSGRRAPRGR